MQSACNLEQVITLVNHKNKEYIKKRRKTMKDEQEKLFFDYKKWYNDLKEKTGGLILQSTAARLLNTPRQNISRMIRIGKIRKYQFNNESEIYIGMDEVEAILKKKIERAKKAKDIALENKDIIMTIKNTVDIEDIDNIEKATEWAEEWIVTRPELPFIQFIEKKKDEYIRKNKIEKKTKRIGNSGLVERLHIALVENANKEEKYALLNLPTAISD